MTTVDISTLDARGNHVQILHCVALSMTAAFRIIDSAAPAPLNRYVRARLRREHGGPVQIGMVRADVDQTD